jgi:hypothetical protein
MKFQIPYSIFHLRRNLPRLTGLALAVTFFALLQVPAALAADDACGTLAKSKGFTGSCKSSCVTGEKESTAFIAGSTNPCSGSDKCCVVAAAGATAGVQTKSTSTIGSTVIKTQNFGLRNPLGARSVPVIIGQLVAWLGSIAGSLFFAYLIWGGVEWMTAGGSPEKVKTGREKILYAVLGIVIVMVAYLAVDSIVGVTSFVP